MVGPALAQAETEHVPFSYTFGPSEVVNPCTGEVVVVTGEVTGFSQVVQTPSGQTVTRYHLVEQGTGVGSEGNKYIYHQTFNGQVNGRPPFTDNFSILLISERSEDNWLLNLRSEEHTLNSSHANISYAVFCLKKKNNFGILL